MSRRLGPQEAKRRPGRPRPEHWLAPAGSVLVLLIVWGAVAHASGSGWVQALAALAAGVALVGMIGPGLALRRARLEVTSSPADGRSGQPFEVTVVSSVACRCRPLRPTGDPFVLHAGKPAHLLVRPAYRGVLGAVEVAVQSASPFGLLWWSARRRLLLPRPLVIAPRYDSESLERTASTAGEEGSGPVRLAERGERRGARLYRVGDSPRHVDWRSTAHTGTLMVSESDAASKHTVTVVGELSDDADLAEAEASKLMRTIASLLDDGRLVVLETTGEAGRVSGRVSNGREAGRRLAQAGRNPWADLARERDGAEKQGGGP